MTDRHEGDFAARIHLAAWALVGAGIGFFGAIAAARAYGLSGWVLFVGPPIGAAVCYAGAWLVSRAAGGAVLGIVAPSGRTTPSAPEYSYADALAARGQFEQAAAALQANAAERPLDPEPRLRLARLYRDRLGRPEDALAWFRRARDVARPAQASSIVRELLDVARRHLADPGRALPDLARLAETEHGAGADWARRQLKEIRRSVWDAGQSGE